MQKETTLTAIVKTCNDSLVSWLFWSYFVIGQLSDFQFESLHQPLERDAQLVVSPRLADRCSVERNPSDWESDWELVYPPADRLES